MCLPSRLSLQERVQATLVYKWVPPCRQRVHSTLLLTWPPWPSAALVPAAEPSAGLPGPCCSMPRAGWRAVRLVSGVCTAAACSVWIDLTGCTLELQGSAHSACTTRPGAPCRALPPLPAARCTIAPIGALAVVWRARALNQPCAPQAAARLPVHRFCASGCPVQQLGPRVLRMPACLRSEESCCR